DIVLDVAGVGYLVHATTGVITDAAQAEGELTIQTHLNVREDALQLFGFANAGERELFERLTGLQGIGPKVAISIVSAISVADLRRAVAAGDVALLQSINGVGPKMARRIVTELSGKLEDLVAAPLSAQVQDSDAGTSFYEAREALQALGLSVEEAERALRE